MNNDPQNWKSLSLARRRWLTFASVAAALLIWLGPNGAIGFAQRDDRSFREFERYQVPSPERLFRKLANLRAGEPGGPRQGDGQETASPDLTRVEAAAKKMFENMSPEQQQNIQSLAEKLFRNVGADPEAMRLELEKAGISPALQQQLFERIKSSSPEQQARLKEMARSLLQGSEFPTGGGANGGGGDSANDVRQGAVAADERKSGLSRSQTADPSSGSGDLNSSRGSNGFDGENSFQPTRTKRRNQPRYNPNGEQPEPELDREEIAGLLESYRAAQSAREAETSEKRRDSQSSRLPSNPRNGLEGPSRAGNSSEFRDQNGADSLSGQRDGTLPGGQRRRFSGDETDLANGERAANGRELTDRASSASARDVGALGAGEKPTTIGPGNSRVSRERDSRSPNAVDAGLADGEPAAVRAESFFDSFVKRAKETLGGEKSAPTRSNERLTSRIDRVFMKAIERTLDSKESPMGVPGSVDSIFDHLVEEVGDVVRKNAKRGSQAAGNRGRNNAGGQNSNGQDADRLQELNDLFKDSLKPSLSDRERQSVAARSDDRGWNRSSKSEPAVARSGGGILDSLALPSSSGMLEAISKSWWPLLLFVTGVAVFAILIWGIFLRPQARKMAPRHRRRRLAKLTSKDFKTPEDLIEVIDWFLLENFGQQSSWWSSAHAKRILSASAPENQAGVEAMMLDYVKARYSSQTIPISARQQESYEAILKLLSRSARAATSGGPSAAADAEISRSTAAVGQQAGLGSNRDTGSGMNRP